MPRLLLGAVVALIVCGMELNVMSLIGIVKKNAIMMIDFAIDARRSRGIPPEEAITEACLLRFRPITMTTLAALLGGLPLALGNGPGAELRWPLGVAIVGGLAASQLLTLFTTPVVYLCLDSLLPAVDTGPRSRPSKRGAKSPMGGGLTVPPSMRNDVLT